VNVHRTWPTKSPREIKSKFFEYFSTVFLASAPSERRLQNTKRVIELIRKPKDRKKQSAYKATVTGSSCNSKY
jgi:hypothetical protein